MPNPTFGSSAMTVNYGQDLGPWGDTEHPTLPLEFYHKPADYHWEAFYSLSSTNGIYQTEPSIRDVYIALEAGEFDAPPENGRGAPTVEGEFAVSGSAPSGGGLRMWETMIGTSLGLLGLFLRM